MTRRFVSSLFLVALLFVGGSGYSLAQEAPSDVATLVADRISAEGGTTLIAEGNVEVLFGTRRLKAQRITYSRDGGKLLIQGPITLVDENGTIILANSAELDADLQNGVLRSARLVLDRQLQLAAAEINRVDGRYTQLYKTVASSCQVCAANPVPLWQIRAKRIVHDQKEQQLYFSNAQLRIMDFPVFYFPRLRLPDPTLKRATGFLVPKIASTSKLGLGLKVPYFITLGDHADLTLTPYLSAQTRSLEFRVRKAFRTGNVEFNGAVSRDDLIPDRTRGYLFGSGTFNLPKDFILGFDLETVADPGYLLEYGYSDKDRLASDLTLLRARRDELITASLTRYHSLRSAEDNRTIPYLVGDARYEFRFVPGLIGGQADFSFEAHSHYRRSDTPGMDGRDVLRATAQLDWRKSWTLRNGMIASAISAVSADFYNIEQDPAFPGSSSRITPSFGAELRWPLVKVTDGGVTHTLEPVVQLLWTKKTAATHPNEDSTLIEFDEGNLFALSRFPGADRREQGTRANLGVSWRRVDPAGWSLGVTVGKVFRTENLGQFAPRSGLTGTSSDWLAMVQLKLPKNLSLANRALFGDDLRFTTNETRIDWHNDRWNLSSSYIWVAADHTSVWTMDGAVKLSDYWTAKADWRFDFETGKATKAGVGMEYRNECIAVDFSLSRRFTSSSSVDPTTRFGLTVALTGFGTGGATGPTAKQCRTYK